MEIEFGDIALVPFPFTDQRTLKRRPAVVVSTQRYNRGCPDIILMAVTSQPGTRGLGVPIRGWVVLPLYLEPPGRQGEVHLLQRSRAFPS